MILDFWLCVFHVSMNVLGGIVGCQFQECQDRNGNVNSWPYNCRLDNLSMQASWTLSWYENHSVIAKLLYGKMSC